VSKLYRAIYENKYNPYFLYNDEFRSRQETQSRVNQRSSTELRTENRDRSDTLLHLTEKGNITTRSKKQETIKKPWKGNIKTRGSELCVGARFGGEDSTRTTRFARFRNNNRKGTLAAQSEPRVKIPKRTEKHDQRVGKLKNSFLFGAKRKELCSSRGHRTSCQGAPLLDVVAVDDDSDARGGNNDGGVDDDLVLCLKQEVADAFLHTLSQSHQSQFPSRWFLETSENRVLIPTHWPRSESVQHHPSLKTGAAQKQRQRQRQRRGMSVKTQRFRSGLYSSPTRFQTSREKW